MSEKYKIKYQNVGKIQNKRYQNVGEIQNKISECRKNTK